MGPLDGVTVVELAGIGPGPFAAMVLADLGARVIRIDRPGQPSELAGGSGAARFDITSRGRESVTLDLRADAGVAAALALVERADVLIEGFRPGVAERLGLGPEVALARNPRLVYGRMTGWGQEGPLAERAGHDLTYIALSGALGAIGPAGGAPVAPLNLVGDYGGGAMLLVQGVLAALVAVAAAERRGEPGGGQVVDAAMIDGAALLLAPIYGAVATGRWGPRGTNLLDGGAPFYDSYQCADGRWFAVAALEPKFYAELVAGLGIEVDLATQYDRATWPQLRDRIAEAIRSRSRDDWERVFEGTDACAAPVLDLAEAPAHAHALARGTFVVRDGVAQPAPAPRFSGTPTRLPDPAPAIGADTEAVLTEVGLDVAAIAAATGT